MNANKQTGFKIINIKGYLTIHILCPPTPIFYINSNLRFSTEFNPIYNSQKFLKSQFLLQYTNKTISNTVNTKLVFIKYQKNILQIIKC